MPLFFATFSAIVIMFTQPTEAASIANYANSVFPSANSIIQRCPGNTCTLAAVEVGDPSCMVFIASNIASIVVTS